MRKKTELTLETYNEIMFDDGMIRTCLDYRNRLEARGLTGKDMHEWRRKNKAIAPKLN